jgi:hypothetical protein
MFDACTPAFLAALLRWGNAGMHAVMQLLISTKRFWHLAKCQKVWMGLHAIRGIHDMQTPTSFHILIT